MNEVMYTVLQVQQFDAKEYVFLFFTGCGIAIAIGFLASTFGFKERAASLIAIFVGIPVATAISLWANQGAGPSWRCVYQLQDSAGKVLEKQHNSKFDCVKPGNVVYLPASK